MQRYKDYLSDVHGNGLGGVTVTVNDAGTTNLASLFDKDGVAKDNPFATDDDGFFEFYAANGEYDIEFSSLNVNKTILRAQILEVLTGTTTLAFPSIAAQSSADLTITVDGAEEGQVVALGIPAAIEAGLVFNAFVSAANTVTVRASNVTAGAIDPVDTHSFTVKVF